MGTEPPAPARRVGWFPDGACADPPPELDDWQGVFLCLVLSYSPCLDNRDDSVPTEMSRLTRPRGDAPHRPRHGSFSFRKLGRFAYNLTS